MELVKTLEWQKGFEAIADNTPANETAIFNARHILRANGFNNGAHDRIIKKCEEARPHHIERIGKCQWQWRFEE